MPKEGTVEIDPSKLAVQHIIAIAKNDAYQYVTLVLQARIWAKLNGLDEKEEIQKALNRVEQLRTEFGAEILKAFGYNPQEEGRA